VGVDILAHKFDISKNIEMKLFRWHWWGLAAIMALPACRRFLARCMAFLTQGFPLPMRRWLLIILLLVYPFQATLAMADQCCVTTPAGVTHHSADGEPENAAAVASLIADDASSPLADPHCPACVFGHLSGVPAQPLVLPAAAHQPAAVASATPFFTSLPAPRPERPQWPAAAH
jgi:hypothetical protein